MKIACIAPSRVPSRTAHSIQLMKSCHALGQNGHTVRLWTPKPGGSDWQVLAEQYGLEQQFEISWLPSLKALRRYDFILAALKAAYLWQAEVVYTWLPQVAMIAGIRKIPVVLELHDLPAGLLGPWFVSSFLHQKGPKRLACITQALLDALRGAKNLNLDSNITVIAPNGVELERFFNLPEPAEARALLGLPEKPTALYSGHFYAGRGMNLLLNLASGLPHIQFLWVGGNENEIESWRTSIQEKGLENVILTGFITNSSLALYQAAGDFLLMPYEREIAGSSGGNSASICSPMKMFEYLATGRVIVASDLKVLHEVINETCAVFCPPDDSKAWIDQMQELLLDSSRMVIIGNQAKKVAEKYSWRERELRIMEGLR